MQEGTLLQGGGHLHSMLHQECFLKDLRHHFTMVALVVLMHTTPLDMLNHVEVVGMKESLVRRMKETNTIVNITRTIMMSLEEEEMGIMVDGILVWRV